MRLAAPDGTALYAAGADGAVTEYRYDSAGNQVSKLEYAEATYDVSALLATDPITESALNAWVSALADKSWVKRTDTHYDLRGNVERVVSRLFAIEEPLPAARKAIGRDRREGSG